MRTKGDVIPHPPEQATLRPGGAVEREVKTMRKMVLAVFFTAAVMMVAGIAHADPFLKVHTDKTTYAVGEEVQISLVNEWHDYIGSGLGYYVTTPDGEPVWVVAWAMIMVGVPPDGSLDYVWDQTYQMSSLGDDFQQVAPGHYVIHANSGNGLAHIWIE